MSIYTYPLILPPIELPDAKPVMGWFNPCNGSQFLISAFLTLGSIQYPRRGISLGVDRVGFFFFPLSWVSAEYVADKLFRHQLGDAGAFADWLNCQTGNFYNNPKDEPIQQHEYSEEYIATGVDVLYGLIGENKIPIIQPEITDG